MIDQPPNIPNPLTPLGYTEAELFSPGFFGAVCARAGVGKTAFLVQVALWAISKGKRALHISLSDPIKKVDLWYKDVFINLANQAKIKDPSSIWELLLPKRFIMTFKVEGFSVPKLEERMMDLIHQGIFTPDFVIIDGLSFEESLRNPLTDLKTLARKHQLEVWFSARTHHFSPPPDGAIIPQPIHDVADLFESIVHLEGSADKIKVKNLKGGSGTQFQPAMRIDPSTWLLTTDE
ncbi:MAG: hypothetical protein A2V65_07270 [Deltaproteobacteria bacterium RBG_13_49_15]|nr:MAG: hypothetical protein A2V65_07270 [Deltaproteobacteria bacterium RBG_13_49_15]